MGSRTLKDMVVVITGASAGIGKALSHELGKQGARLVLAARRIERLEELNSQLGGGHLCLRIDVARQDDCRQLIDQTVQRFGRIDTLVCNAGYGLYRTVANTSIEETRQIFDTNVFGTTDCIHFALPVMQKQEQREGYRGQIMIVSSAVARRGVPYLGMYSATKAAQLALAEAMRIELKPQRIAVSSVHPIQTGTEFGKVAKSLGEVDLPPAPMEQTVDVVARAMVRAMIKPRPEVWPSRPARWVFGLGTLMPRLADAGVAQYRKKVEQKNASSTPGNTKAG